MKGGRYSVIPYLFIKARPTKSVISEITPAKGKDVSNTYNKSNYYNNIKLVGGIGLNSLRVASLPCRAGQTKPEPLLLALNGWHSIV